MTYNNTMNYTYKTFTFICFALSAVTKEMAIKVAPDNSIELFDDILYQRLDNVDDNVQNIYFAWSTIKELVDRSFPYGTYEETLDDILYNDTVFELSENFDKTLLRKLDSLIGNNKETFNLFNEIGANRFLDELIKMSN